MNFWISSRVHIYWGSGTAEFGIRSAYGETINRNIFIRSDGDTTEVKGISRSLRPVVTLSLDEVEIVAKAGSTGSSVEYTVSAK